MKLNRECLKNAQVVFLMAWLSVSLNCATGATGNNARAGRLLEMRPVILSGLRPSDVPSGWMEFRGQAQWEEFWSEHSFKPAPEIDFEDFVLVVIFLGQKPNTGYSVKIVEAREYPEKVVVRAIRSEPSPDRLYAQVLVHPYDAVLIPETGKRLECETVQEGDHL